MSDPDYGNLGDHTETVQIDYDPRRIAYADLLRIFWNSHEPGQHTWKRQYMNAIFYHDQRQQQLGLESRAAMEKEMGRTIHTRVLPLRAFYRAEDYHQKYLINRRSELANELVRIYPLKKDFVDSTAVARINGYVGGHGDVAQLTRELESLGLSQDSQQALLELVRRRGGKLLN